MWFHPLQVQNTDWTDCKSGWQVSTPENSPKGERQLSNRDCTEAFRSEWSSAKEQMPKNQRSGNKGSQTKFLQEASVAVVSEAMEMSELERSGKTESWEKH